MILKAMEISTAHITGKTAAFLYDKEKLEDAYLVVYNKEDYGWFIVVPDVNAFWWEEYSEKIPVDLLECLKLARENECCYLILDCDAEIIEDLPEYDW